MPRYQVRKAMNLSGTLFPRGSVVPEELVATIPPGRLRSLINTGLFTEVVETEEEAPTATPGEETCPVCGESFKRLAQHISMKHETVEALEEAHLNDGE